MTVEFKIMLVGEGETVEDCWNDAVNSFGLGAEVLPDESQYEMIEDE